MSTGPNHPTRDAPYITPAMLPANPIAARIRLALRIVHPQEERRALSAGIAEIERLHVIATAVHECIAPRVELQDGLDLSMEVKAHAYDLLRARLFKVRTESTDTSEGETAASPGTPATQHPPDAAGVASGRAADSEVPA